MVSFKLPGIHFPITILFLLTVEPVMICKKTTWENFLHFFDSLPIKNDITQLAYSASLCSICLTNKCVTAQLTNKYIAINIFMPPFALENVSLKCLS